MEFKKEKFPDMGKIYWAVDEDAPDTPFIVFFELDGLESGSGQWKQLAPMFNGFERNFIPVAHSILDATDTEYLLFGDEICSPIVRPIP